MVFPRPPHEPAIEKRKGHAHLGAKKCRRCKHHVIVRPLERWALGNSARRIGRSFGPWRHILRQKGTEVTTIEPEATLKRAADWLRAKNIGSVVVTSGNSILGVISEREIVHALSQFGEQVASMAVKDIMRHGLVTVAPEDDLSRVMKLITRHRMRHMPVLRDGKLSGIISIGDVVKHRLDDLESEANVLRDAYIAHH